MYCGNCGNEIDGNANICVNCGVLTNEDKPKRKFYKAGFVLGILSLCIPICGLILGVIGLPMAIISKRKSSIITNSIGIVARVTLILMILLLFPGLALYKTAITAREFSNKATSLEYTIIDATEQYDGLTAVSLAAIDGTESYIVVFHKVETIERAISAFAQNKTDLDAVGLGTALTLNGRNWGKFSKTTDEYYCYVSYIDNTFVYGRVPKEYKQATKNFIKEIGY